MSPSGPFPGPPPSGQPRLLDRVREAIRARHYSLRTEEAYVGWIRRYILFHNKRHPLEMAEPEINAFVTHLAVEGPVSASTQTQALSALMFLYRHVLGKSLPELETVIRAKRPGRLPSVLTRAEVRRILGRMNGTPRLVSTLLYGTGMRLLECLRLRVKDLEFGNNRIVVRDTKGGEDRVVPFPLVARAEMPSWLSRVKRIHERPRRRFRQRLPSRRHREESSPAPSANGAGSTSSPASTAATTRAGKGVAPKAGNGPAAGAPPADRATPNPSAAITCTRPSSSAPFVGRPRRRHLAADQLPHLPPLLRDPPARRGVRYPHHPGAPRPQRREDDDDLHACAQPWRPGRPQPCGHPLRRHDRQSVRQLYSQPNFLTALVPPERQLVAGENIIDDPVPEDVD